MAISLSNERENIPNIVNSMDNDSLAERFTNMLNKVTNMIQSDGPIYSIWIKFQLGLSKPIIFDSSSRDINKNLIANLTVNKNLAGAANSFNIVVRYDSFNYGQQTKNNTLELLDDYIAQAMSHDWDDDSSKLMGRIQYGYNYDKDSSLISPCYTFILTGANSEIDFDSGMTTYNFEGVSTMATDCDFETPFPAVEDTSLLQLVADTLYQYYGNPNKRPSIVSSSVQIESSAEKYCYDIDIPDKLFKDSPKINEAATTDMSPWKYCLNLLNNNPLTASEEESGEYNDLSSLDYSKRPRYTMWLTDNDNGKVIHITHSTPEDPNSSTNTKIDFDFTWTRDNRNLILKWSPQVNLYYYLICKSNNLRTADKLRKGQMLEATTDDKSNNPSNDPVKQKNESTQNKTQPSYRTTGTPSLNISAPITLVTNPGPTVPVSRAGIGSSIISGGLSSLLSIFNKENVTSTGSVPTITTTTIAEATWNKTVQADEEVVEIYDAEMITIGIPADVPVLGEINVKPIILETVSRTAGVYAIKGASDNISTNGLYTTTLQLFRSRSLDK